MQGENVRLKSRSRSNAPELKWEHRWEGEDRRVALLAFALNAAKAIPGNGGKPFVLAGSPRVESKHGTPYLLLMPFMCVYNWQDIQREG